MEKGRAEVGGKSMIDQCIELLTLRFQFGQIRGILFFQLCIQTILRLNKPINQHLFFAVEHQPAVLKCAGSQCICKLSSLVTAEKGSGGGDQFDHGFKRNPQTILYIGCF